MYVFAPTPVEKVVANSIAHAAGGDVEVRAALPPPGQKDAYGGYQYEIHPGDQQQRA